jgi:hypothetical protein
MNNIQEARGTKRKAFEIWKTSRGNYRAQDAAGGQRTFKKYSDAIEWIKSTKEKKAVKAKSRIKGVTAKSELKKVISFIRSEIKKKNEKARSGGEPGESVDFEKVTRKVLAALSKINTKLI